MRGDRALALGAMVLALAACGRSDDAAAPGDVTVSEAKALDEAAEMIEARRPPPPVATPSAPLPPAMPAPAASAAAR
jgi:hypothetical protein